MSNKQIQGHQDDLIRVMVLEDKIIDYKLASMRLDRGNWLSQYFDRRYHEKIREWERITGRKYSNT